MTAAHVLTRASARTGSMESLCDTASRDNYISSAWGDYPTCQHSGSRFVSPLGDPPEVSHRSSVQRFFAAVRNTWELHSAFAHPIHGS